jgi:hypothetical protein
MPNRIRQFTAASATAALALAVALPARADRVAEIGNEPSSVPIILDAAVLRPIGLVTTIIGAVFYVFPVAPLMAVTRPADVFKPLKPLVGYPVQFTFIDPIGVHPGPAK